ncbi:MAG: hypothetical protein ACI8W8_001981 [Rhodothermales bacterium]|jgi:hypothetical protein
MSLKRKQGGFVLLMVLGIGSIMFLLLGTVIHSAASFQKSNRQQLEQVQKRAKSLHLKIRL